jgi:hypothetical protein
MAQEMTKELPWRPNAEALLVERMMKQTYRPIEMM